MQNYEAKFLTEKQEIDILRDDVFILNNKVSEKVNMINALKKEMGQGNKLIYSMDPTRINVDLNNELNYNRDLSVKLGKLINVEKAQVVKLNEAIKELTRENETLRSETCKCNSDKQKSNKNIICR